MVWEYLKGERETTFKHNVIEGENEISRADVSASTVKWGFYQIYDKKLFL